MENASGSQNNAEGFLSIFIVAPLFALLWFVLPEFFQMNGMHGAHDATVSGEGKIYAYCTQYWPFFALVLVIWTWRSVVYARRHWPRRKTSR